MNYNDFQKYKVEDLAMLEFRLTPRAMLRPPIFMNLDTDKALYALLKGAEYKLTKRV